MNTSISENKQRAVFEFLKNKYGAANVQPSAIRQELELINGKTSYVYDLAVKTGSSATEVLLQRTDTFHALGLGLAIAFQEVAKPGNARLHSYPNGFQLARLTASAAAANTSNGVVPVIGDYETIYNGLMQIKQNTTDIVQKLDTRRFLSIPQTQENGVNDASQFTYGDGLVSIEPQPIFNGSTNNVVSVTVPTFNGMAVQSNKAGWQAQLVLILSGFLILNTTRL